MDDRELEDLLRRYTPTGPAPELRDRSLTMAARSSDRAWPWAAAAAALLVATLGLHTAASRVSARADVRTSPDPAVGAIAELTQLLGGDETARAIAELIVMQHEAARDRENLDLNPLIRGKL